MSTVDGRSCEPENVPVDAGRWLERELGLQRLRTVVAVEVATVVEEHLPAQGELMAAVAADIVARWAADVPAGRKRPALFGPDGFVMAYVWGVEHDRDGRPHPVLGRPGSIVDIAPVRRGEYWAWVWAHHAGWLLRMTAPVPEVERLVAAAAPAGRERIRRLHAELEVERLRTQAAAALTPLVWQALGRDRDKVAVVAAGVVAAWQARGLDDPQTLTGPGGFVDEYYGRVCYERKGECDEDFRPEFLTHALGPGDRVDEPAYERAVWTRHAAQLVGVR
jgi:hypothetical protein